MERSHPQKKLLKYQSCLKHKLKKLKSHKILPKVMRIEKNCSAELLLESSYTAVKWGKLGAGRNVSTNVTAYQMPYIHGLHCGYITT